MLSQVQEGVKDPHLSHLYDSTILTSYFAALNVPKTSPSQGPMSKAVVLFALQLLSSISRAICKYFKRHSTHAAGSCQDLPLLQVQQQ